ncbi:Pyruvate/Phosphoenolpyruvate kinase-like domain [Phytophthora cactorum]|nr:Pyruvate/Phosphoenolpyruvate kinase-like domain [Phytophthora cactorum]
MSRSQLIIYTVDLLSNNVEKGMKLLVDAILNVDLLQELMHVAVNAHRTLGHHRDAEDGHADAAVKVLGSIKELRQQLKLLKLVRSVVPDLINKLVQVLSKKLGKSVKYKVVTLIEMLRGAMQTEVPLDRHERSHADDVYRGDAQANFLSYYAKYSVLDKDPFETLDQESVGNQVRLVVKLGRGRVPRSSSASAARMAGSRSFSKMWVLSASRACRCT